MRPTLTHYDSGIAKGFTLIEMLLTVFLIGLMSTMVMVNIDRDSDDIAKLEARRFAALLTQLQDESTISGVPMGLQVSAIDNRYLFWELIENWEKVEKLDVLREREVPDTVTMDFELLQASRDEALDADEEDESPDGENKSSIPKNLILVEPNGLTRPFITGFSGDSNTWNVALDNELFPVVTLKDADAG